MPTSQKIITVLGATGKQGGSVVDAFLADPEYAVRAVVRNAESAAAKELVKRGVEVFVADLADREALGRAFEGTNLVYAMTADIGINAEIIMKSSKSTKPVVEQSYDIELAQGVSIADAVSKVGPSLERLIISSLSDVKKHSGGKYTKVYHFDAKAATVEYLEEKYPELAKKTLVLQLGYFATNWQQPTVLRPTKQPDGRYRILNATPKDALHPMVDPHLDPAIFVKALAKYPPTGKLQRFAGYAEMISYERWAELLTKHLGVEVYFEECSVEDWATTLTLVPGLGEELAEMYAYSAEFGYYGGRTDIVPVHELDLERPPTTMEEYIRNEDWSLLGIESQD